MNASTVKVLCPECHEQIVLTSGLEIGQQVTCQGCNEGLVVVWLFPVCLDYLETKEQAVVFQDISVN